METDVVVIGAGAFGASIAFHLAATGRVRTMLVDQFGIGTQTSAQAAGLTRQSRQIPALSRLAIRSVELFERFTEQTGKPLLFHQSGSINLARRDDDVERIHEEIAAGRALGLEIEAIAVGDLERLAPFCRGDEVRAGWFTPSDLYLDPEQVAPAYAEAAAERGAGIRVHAEVTGIRTRDGAIEGVETSRGTIAAPVVIDTAGGWSRKIAELAGLRIPLVPIRHQLLITEPIAGVKPEHAVCRVMDARTYVRPDRGGLMIGGYEENPVALTIPDRRFSIDEIAIDEAVSRELIGKVAAQFPDLVAAPVRETRQGMPTMTPDDAPLLGAVPGLGGFFVASGCCVGGLSISPAVGEAMAELIVSGRSTLSLEPFALDRFGDAFPDEAAMERACLDAYGAFYTNQPILVPPGG